MSTLLGFDFGPRKIGVAVGQLITGTATPLTVLPARNQAPDWPGLQALIEAWRPVALVLGLPFEMDDTPCDWSPRVHRFARQLEGRFRLPVHLVDERLTTHEAKQRRRSSGRKPGEPIDDLAAALILETWLREQH